MSTLVIIDQPPYGRWAGRDALDMAFSLAAFDRPATLLFMGAGVNWLRNNQNADGIRQKTVQKPLSAAQVFGIENIWADASACERFALPADSMLPGSQRTDAPNALIQNHTHVLFAG